MQRRLQTIETLRRIEERELEVLARELTAAQTIKAQAEAQIVALQSRALHEAKTTEPEALPYIGRFLATIRREQNRAAHEARAVEGRIDNLQSQVMVRFSAEKTFDTLKTQVLTHLREARSKQEEAQLDEIASVKFRAAQ